MNRYTSKTIYVKRNSKQTIEVPFDAQYLQVKAIRQSTVGQFEGATFITLQFDDGEEFPLIKEDFEINFDFKKLTIAVGMLNNTEDIPFFYFIAGKGKEGESTITEQPTITMDSIPLSQAEVIELEKTVEALEKTLGENNE